jgi:predicted NodU family carbamoyl transferase
MLVNTSLNIKGQPIVNDLKDAEDFSKHYGTNVFTPR